MPKFRLGSIEHQRASAHLPIGPQSVQELFDWPTFVVCQLCESGSQAAHRLRRLRAILDQGILASSEFSGWDSQIEATRCCSQALSSFCGEPTRGFLWLNSCDNEALPRNVLCQMSSLDHGFACVHGDINERLPATVMGGSHIHVHIVEQFPCPLPHPSMLCH